MVKNLMFQVPLFSTMCIDWENKKNNLLKLYKNLTFNDEQYTDWIHNKKSNYCDEIEDIFKYELEQFENILKIKNIEIINSWFEKSLLNNYHSAHNHGATGYSAVCYIKFNKFIHKPLTFISPFGSFFTGTTLYYTPEFVEEGTILFFPSTINHYVTPNNSDIERLVVSFNMSFPSD